MLAGLPSERSVFDYRTIQDIHNEIRDVYRRYPQPWVIGYSDGKDSTTVLQLIWNAIKELPLEEREKPIFVIASDTQVETPGFIRRGTANAIAQLQSRHSLQYVYCTNR